MIFGYTMAGHYITPGGSRIPKKLSLQVMTDEEQIRNSELKLINAFL